MSQPGDVPTIDDDGEADRREFLVRAAAVIAASTLALTAAFVGVVAFLDGATAGVGDRLPFYVLASAATFVASLLLLDHEDVSATAVIVATTVVAATAFVIVGLAAEGVRYAVIAPGEVFGDRLVVYFVAAGLICTGLTYWGLNHWREFTGYDDADPRTGAGP